LSALVALLHNGDLDGRVEDLRLEWNGEELDEVLQQGGRALNLDPPNR
jgi:hypothetical protein